jgi:cytochrome bd-type quinol oxidase subunit 2
MKSIKKLALAASSAVGGLLTTASMVMADVNIEPIETGKGYATNFGTMFSSILNVVMLIAAILVFAFMIFGGVEWITSGGDKSKAESARNKLTAAVIGLVIIAASYAVVTLVVQFLGFKDFNDVFNNVGDINNPK